MIPLLYHILNAIFPARCAGCRKVGSGFLCSDCFSKIPVYQTLFCAVCRARLPENKRICHKQSKYLIGAAAQYEGALKNLVGELKYSRKTEALKPLAEILTIYIGRLGPIFKDFLVVPIPLHPKKERQRGFNQSYLLAKAVSEKFGLPLINNLLIKTKNTPPQMELHDWEKRKQNVAGTFAVKNPEQAKNKKILLIDDVTTSGATFNEAVIALKSAGARKVIAIAVARAGN